MSLKALRMLGICSILVMLVTIVADLRARAEHAPPAPVWVLVTVQCYAETSGPMRCGTWPGAPDFYLGRAGETYTTEAECAAARIVMRDRVRAQFRGDEPVNLPTGEAVPPASLTTWCLPVQARGGAAS